MSRPEATGQMDLQLSDVDEAHPLGTSHLVGSDWTPVKHCNAIMKPLCAAMPEADRVFCLAKEKEMCQPDTPFIRCLLGNQAYEGCGAVGFPSGCICAPQTMVVGRAESAANGSAANDGPAAEDGPASPSPG